MNGLIIQVIQEFSVGLMIAMEIMILLVSVIQKKA
jgi:hypothetical protein